MITEAVLHFDIKTNIKTYNNNNLTLATRAKCRVFFISQLQ